MALIVSFFALRGEAAQKKSGRGKYASLGPHFQTGIITNAFSGGY
jgi:hypothetical protein